MSFDLNTFCAPTDPRECLRKPFNIGDRTYACDGNTLVSVPLIESFSAISEPVHFIEKILSFVMPDNAELISLPENIDWPEPKSCKRCKSTGRTESSICPECGGDGCAEAENEYSTYYDLGCNTCSGEGEIIQPGNGDTCAHCNGKGTAYGNHQTVDVFGMRFNPVLLMRITDLPDLALLAMPDEHLLHFKSGDTSGVIMGMRT